MLAAASSQATVAKGECPAPLNNRNQWLREGKPRQKNPGPPGWGLGVGLITPPRKKSLITETEISKNTGYNGCSTTTCRTPDDAFITWIDGAMTTMSETRKGAHHPNKSLNDPKTKVKIGRWNVRTMFSVGKTAQVAQNCRERVKDEGVKILGRGSISCGGQDSLETESLQFNSPLGDSDNIIIKPARKVFL